MKVDDARLVVALCLFFLSQASLSEGASVLVDFDGLYFNNPPYDPAAITAPGGAFALSASDAVTNSSMAATANFGTLLVSTTSTASGLSNSQGGSKAGWQDELTITGGLGSGVLTASFHFSGSLAASDTGGTAASYATYSITSTIFGGSTVLREGGLYSNFGTTGGIIQDFAITNVPFTYGVPLGFDVFLDARTQAVGDGVTLGGPFSASAATSLSLLLSSIQIAQPGAFVSSQSGFAYGVPEPSRAMLFLLGLCALIVRRRRA